MAGHDVLLAAFLMQTDLPAHALRPEVLDLHFQCGPDAREGLGDGDDQRLVAQIADGLGRDRVEQLPPLGGSESWIMGRLITAVPPMIKDVIMRQRPSVLG